MKQILVAICFVIAAATVQAEQITVSWEFTGDDADGFNVYAAPVNGNTVGAPVKVATTLADGRQVVFDIAKGTYQFTATAYNVFGESEPSDPVTARIGKPNRPVIVYVGRP